MFGLSFKTNEEKGFLRREKICKKIVKYAIINTDKEIKRREYNGDLSELRVTLDFYKYYDLNLTNDERNMMTAQVEKHLVDTSDYRSNRVIDKNIYGQSTGTWDMILLKTK